MKIEIKADKDAVLGGPDHIAYLELKLIGDCHALLQVGHRPSGRNVIPVEESSIGTCTWSTSLSPGSYAFPDVAAIEALAECLHPLLARVAVWHSMDWDGSDYASEAGAEIEKLLHAAQWCDQERQVWDADDWLFELGYLGAAKDYGLGVDSNEVAYKAAGRKIEADALRYGVILVNLDALLHRIRQALQIDAKEDA